MALERLWLNRGPEGVKSTLLLMREQVYKSDKDRIVKATAHDIIKNIHPGNHLEQVKAIVGWVRRKLHYVRDIYGVEEVTGPAKMLEQIRKGTFEHSSDCDDYTVLIASLLRAVGFPVRLEALSVGGRGYDHARLSVYVRGKWLNVEGTKSEYAVGEGVISKVPIMAVDL